VKGNQYSYWVKLIFRLACIFILFLFFAWLRTQLFPPDYMRLDGDPCLAEQRAYNQAIRDEKSAEAELEFAINSLVLALAGGAIFGTGLCSKFDVVPAVAGVFACVVAGFIGGLWAIALLDGAPTGTRHKLLRIVMLWAMLLVLHYSSALQSPIPELLTAKREFREKQQETASAYLLFEKCREAGNHSSGLVDEQ
jgi:hypothetical protein